MQITNYKEVNRGFLIGRFNLHLPEFHNLIIREMTYFVKGGARWIGFPQREYEKDGEKRYFPYLTFQKSEFTETFRDEVIKALDSYFSANKSATPYPAAGQATPAPQPTQEELPF
jgi:hypothetical protein